MRNVISWLVGYTYPSLNLRSCLLNWISHTKNSLILIACEVYIFNVLVEEVWVKVWIFGVVLHRLHFLIS